MKKIHLFLTALALICTVAATAFSVSPERKSTDDPMLHWFDVSGNYLGYHLQSVQENDCPGTGERCANGYAQINEEEQPVGSIQGFTEKQ